MLFSTVFHVAMVTIITLIYCVCVRVCTQAHVFKCVEVREQLVVVGALLPQYGVQEIKRRSSGLVASVLVL